MPHWSVRRMVQEGLSTGFRFSPSSAAVKEPGKPDLLNPFVKGKQCVGRVCFCFVFLCFFVSPMYSFSGKQSLGTLQQWDQNLAWTNSPTHLYRHPLWPKSACSFNVLHNCGTHGGMLFSSGRHFLTRKCLSLLLWEAGRSPCGHCTSVCYLHPDGTHGNKCGRGGRQW